MADIDLNAIKLVQITTEEMPGGKPGKAIMLRYETRGGDSLTATYVVDDYQVRDEALVSVARNWFHRTCKDIALATEGWAMDDTQLNNADHQLKNPQAFSRYAGPQ